MVRPVVTVMKLINRTRSMMLSDLRSLPPLVRTSKSLGIGEVATIPFTQPGTGYYECTLHPQQMRGKVIVTQ